MCFLGASSGRRHGRFRQLQARNGRRTEKRSPSAPSTAIASFETVANSTSENLLQRPGYVSIGVLRSLTPRVLLTADYSLAITALERTGDTPPLFEMPGSVVDHGALLAIDADRGRGSLRGWWNPVAALWVAAVGIARQLRCCHA
jgi:hypothetical protein